MADIQSIVSAIWTSKEKNSGTDGDVYLGICGREFYLDTPDDDYEAGLAVNATVGVGSTVSNPEDNDPRAPYRLRTQDLGRYPTYLRLDGSDHWKLLYAVVLVWSGPDSASMQLTDRFDIPFAYTSDTGGLWLGPEAGKWIHLRRSGERDLTIKLRKAKLLEAFKRMQPRVRPRARPPRRRK